MTGIFVTGCGLRSSAQLHPVVPPHVLHLRHVPFRTSVKFPHSPQASPSYPCAFASARFSAASALASARASVLDGGQGTLSSASVGEGARSGLRAAVPSTWPWAPDWARAPESEVIFEVVLPPPDPPPRPSPARGEGDEAPPRSVPP